MYYGVECNDYIYPVETARTERAETYIREGDTADATIPRLSTIFYGDLPCAFWPTLRLSLRTMPSGPAATAPLVAEGIPTLVLGATADPATPVSNGEQVYSHLADGYLITTKGGPHVIFGWGKPVPTISSPLFWLKTKCLRKAKSSCEGVVADAYVPPPSNRCQRL